MDREPEAYWRLYGQALAYHTLGRKKEADAALAELILKHEANWRPSRLPVCTRSAGTPTGRSSGWSGPTREATPASSG